MTMPIATHVPPSWSLTTLTASSTGPFAGLLHPTADHEVHRVFARDISTSPTSSPMQTPSRAFPSSSSRARRLRRPLPPRRHRLTTGSTSRPFSTRESVAHCSRCQPLRARYSHGLPNLKHRARHLLCTTQPKLSCPRRFAPKRVPSNDRPKPSERDARRNGETSPCLLTPRRNGPPIHTSTYASFCLPTP